MSTRTMFSFHNTDLEAIEPTLKTIVEWITDRDYDLVGATLKFEQRNRGFGLVLVVHGEKPELQHTHDYTKYMQTTSYYASSIQELAAKVNTSIASDFPTKVERMTADFTKRMAELAELADKIGTEVPEFNTFATVLRDQIQSNLLTGPR